MRAVSLYIHIPFCKRRCPYCTFYHVPHTNEYEDAFIGALVAELERAAREIDEPFYAPTVFLGGGTPSTLGPQSLARIFDAIAPYLQGDREAEITLEMNPEDVTAGLVSDLEHLGVNRVSLGIQSMSDRALRVLRRCTADANRHAIERVSRRFDNFSVDLLLGVPGGSSRELDDTLSAVLAHRPPHVSLYCLEPDENMERAVRDFLDTVDAESAADEYLLACDRLRRQGHRHYEVSNFARPGYESRHNHTYWDGSEYLGIGPGAHSLIARQRFHNEPSIELYLRTAATIRLRRRDLRDEAQRELETLMLALRTSRGLPLERLSCPPHVPRELVKQGLAGCHGDRLVLTDRGYLLLNDILFRLTQAA